MGWRNIPWALLCHFFPFYHLAFRHTVNKASKKQIEWNRNNRWNKSTSRKKSTDYLFIRGIWSLLLKLWKLQRYSQTLLRCSKYVHQFRIISAYALFPFPSNCISSYTAFPMVSTQLIYMKWASSNIDY